MSKTIDEQEDLILEAAQLHQVPDWEGLMDLNITPAIFIDGERRLHRKSYAATPAVGDSTAPVSEDRARRGMTSKPRTTQGSPHRI